MTDTEKKIDDRLVMVRALCAIARADGHIDPSERARIRRLTDFLRLNDGQKAEAMAMLDESGPAPTLPSPEELPAYDVRLYVFQQALVMTYVDGHVHDGERAVLGQLADVLALKPDHVETAWRRAAEMTER